MTDFCEGSIASDDVLCTIAEAATIIGIPHSSLNSRISNGYWILDKPRKMGRGNCTRLPRKEVDLVAALYQIGFGHKEAIQLAQSGRVSVDDTCIHIAHISPRS